jgi:hypothetical protein
MYTKQTIEALGIPYVEYGYDEPEVEQRIQIEFTPRTHRLDDYAVPEPAFTFCEEVALGAQYDYCLEQNLDLSEELDTFYICALELVECRSQNGVLTDKPYWCYGIRKVRGTRELLWFEEDELVRPVPPQEEEF